MSLPLPIQMISIIIHAKIFYPENAITKSMVMAQISEGDIITYLQVQLNIPLSSSLSAYSAQEREQYQYGLRRLLSTHSQTYRNHFIEQTDSGLALLLTWTILLALETYPGQ